MALLFIYLCFRKQSLINKLIFEHTVTEEYVPKPESLDEWLLYYLSDFSSKTEDEMKSSNEPIPIFIKIASYPEDYVIRSYLPLHASERIKLHDILSLENVCRNNVKFVEKTEDTFNILYYEATLPKEKYSLQYAQRVLGQIENSLKSLHSTVTSEYGRGLRVLNDKEAWLKWNRPIISDNPKGIHRRMKKRDMFQLMDKVEAYLRQKGMSDINDIQQGIGSDISITALRKNVENYFIKPGKVETTTVEGRKFYALINDQKTV